MSFISNSKKISIVYASIFLSYTIRLSSIFIIYVYIMARSGWHIACNIINLCFKHHYKTRPTSRPIFQFLTILKRIKRRLSVIFPWFCNRERGCIKNILPNDEILFFVKLSNSIVFPIAWHIEVKQRDVIVKRQGHICSSRVKRQEYKRYKHSIQSSSTSMPFFRFL